MIRIPFRFEHRLIFIEVTLQHNRQSLRLTQCIWDTGSAGTTFDTDMVSKIGLLIEPHDPLRRLVTAGGYQFVFLKDIDQLILGPKVFPQMRIEIGDLASKFHIDGILGTDLISRFDWELRFSTQELVLQDLSQSTGD